eukprot:NODE_53_length_30760_cov_1.203712.p3 type:complete len:922 gc:universal NODE_53_length_30760_cov_1.203712:15846-18611(+)
MEDQKNKAHRRQQPKANANNVKGFTNKININYQRKQDLLEKKLHVPTIDKINGHPPYVVAIHGPPGVGKTTLIRGLIKKYSSQNITNPKGPITLACNKTRRITLLQVENTIESCIDTSKIADIVILMINAKDGLTMNTMEYIHCLQAHGCPKIISVLTHLDHYKENKQQRNIKKLIKDRLWKELYGGLKVFFMSGVKYNDYLKRDLLNLTRFINTQKVRPLQYRTTHSYMLVDRMEDVTPPTEIEADPNADRQVALYGYTRGLPFTDTSVHLVGVGDLQMKEISKCPDPCKLMAQQQRLNNMHKSIYAPQCDLNGIQYDKDAIYIHMPATKENPLKEDLKKTTFEEYGEMNMILGQENVESDSESSRESQKSHDTLLEDNVSEIDEASEASFEPEDVAPKIELFGDDNGELLQQHHVSSDEDVFEYDSDSEEDVGQLFVTGMNKDVENILQSDEDFSDGFEDVSSENESNDEVDASDVVKKTTLLQSFEQQQKDKEEEGTFFEKEKQKLQEQFDQDMSQVEKLNPEDIQNTKGILPGTYIKIIVSLSPEFVDYWDANRVCIVGGVHSNESQLGFVECQIKKHKWYPQVLKSNDPVIVSMGWRRMEVMPNYFMHTPNGNNYLKYTPEWDSCNMGIYAYNIAPNTGVIGFTKLSAGKHFSISFLGHSLGNKTHIDIRKKLKLVGSPYEIKKNTAFIKDMFASEMEVGKFENAMIRTVSGIRGQIKKSLGSGKFRATFEDKILKSDIVFLKTWIQLPVEPYCIAVTNMLLPSHKIWKGMRNMRELRDELGIKPTLNQDSLYKPIERVEKKFHPLRIPQKLEMKLPFSTRPKLQLKLSKNSWLKKRAVVLNKTEKERLTMLQQLRTVKNDQESKREKQKKIQHEKYSMEEKKKEEKKAATIKERQIKRGIKRNLQEARDKKQKRN